MLYYYRLSRYFSYVLIAAFILLGCKDGKKSQGPQDDAGTEDGGEPSAGCEPAFSMLTPSGSTRVKETEVLFEMTGCVGAEALLRRNGNLFDPAVHLGAGRYRRFVSLTNGENTFTVVSATPDGEVEGPSVVLTYTPGPPAEGPDSGLVTGRVIRETDKGPVANATLFLRGVEGELQTDADGAFRFPTPGPGRFVLTVEAEGHTLGQRRVEVLTGSVFNVGDIRLMPLDMATAEISPTEGGTLKSSAGDIELVIPAGAVRQARTISGLSYPSGESLPNTLPDSSRWTQAFDLHPDGVRLQEPAELKLDNVNGFAPGTNVPIGYYNRNTAAWEPEGMGVVSADGQWIVATVTHFSSHDVNLPVDEEGRPGFGKNRGKRCEGRKGSSIIDDETGQLLLYAPFSSGYREGNGELYSLVYDTAKARPYAPVLAPFTVDRNDGMERLEATVDLNGARKNLFLDAPSGDDGYLLGTVFDETDTFVTPLTTGVYNARVQLAALSTTSYMSTDVFGAPGQSDLGVETRELVPFETEQTLPVAVVNESSSPFGAGWRFEKEEFIVPVEGSNQVLWYGQGDSAIVPMGLPKEDHASFTCFTMYNNIIDFYFLDNGQVLLVGLQQVRVAQSLETAADATLLLEPENGIVGAAMAQEGLWFLDAESVLHLMSDSGTIIRSIDVNALFIAHRDTHPDLTVSHFLTTGAMAVDGNGVVYVALDGYGFVGVDTTAAVPTLELYPMLALPLVDDGDIAVRSMVYEASTHSLYLHVTAAEVIEKYDLFSRNETTFLQVGGSGYRGSTALSLSPSGDLYYAVDDDMGYVGPGRLVVPISGSEFGMVERFGCFADAIRFNDDGDAVVLCTEYDSTPNYRRHHLISTHPNAGLSAITGETVLKTADGYRIEEDFQQQAWKGYREFDSQGRMVRRVTREGAETLTYGAGGLERYVSATGYGLDFIYDASGRLSGIADSAGPLASVTIDGSGDLTAIQDSDGVSMSFIYDGHRMVRRESPAGESLEYQWNDSGSITGVLQSSGRTRGFRSLLQGAGVSGISDKAENPAVLTEGAWEAKHWYGKDGRLSAIEYGGVRWEVSTGFSNTDPTLPNWTTVTLSGRDNETFELLLVGDALRYLSYNDEVLLQISRALLDENGQNISDGVVESFADNREGINCGFTYDGEERVTVADCTSLYAEYVYLDEDDLPDQILDVNGNITAFTYDQDGNVDTIIHPTSDLERFERNPAGFITAFEDINGRRTTLERDGKGNPISVTDPLGRTATIEYDHALTCDECAGHRVDVPSRITDPAGNSWTLAVRPDSRIGSVTDPGGNTRSFGYDARGNLVSMAGQGDAGCEIQFDPRGNVVMEHIGAETVTHEYDARDRAVRSEGDTALLTRSYNDETHEVLETVTDKLTGMTAEVGWVQRPTRAQISSFHSSVGHGFTANDDSKWYSAGWTNDTGFVGEVSAYRSSAGHISERAVANTDYYTALMTSHYYDEMQRPYYDDIYIGVDGYRYGYCDRVFEGGSELVAGLACTGEIGMPDNAAYTYDAMGWLTGFSLDKGGRSYQGEYQYDNAGLMVSHSDVGTLRYDAALRLTATDRATYTYDPRGTRATRTDSATGEVRRYTYNGSEQLIAVEIFENAAATAPVSTIRLTHGPQGRLFRIDQDGTLTYLLWLGDQLIAELDENGNAIRRYLPGEMPDQVAVINQDGVNYYVIHDEVGTIHQIVDETGAPAADYDYDPWGRVLRAEGTLADQPRRFQGAYYLASIGLYYFRARFYDPEVGMFISEDPAIVLDTTMNRYRFADNNPVSNMDPFGFKKSPNGANVVRSKVTDFTKAVIGRNKYAGQALKAYDNYKLIKKFLSFANNDKKGNFKRGVDVFMDLIPGFSDSDIGKKIKNNFVSFTQKVNAKIPKPRPPRCREATAMDRMFLDQNAEARKK